MAKKKQVASVKEVEELIEEVKEEDKEVIEIDEKDQLDSFKKKICEFYGIRDDELFNPDCDLSKYGLKKQEEEALLKRAKENKKVKSWDVVFDIYTTNVEAWAIIAKYGITPKDVAEWNMELLSAEEKEIITAYYNDLMAKL